MRKEKKEQPFDPCVFDATLCSKNVVEHVLSRMSRVDVAEALLIHIQDFLMNEGGCGCHRGREETEATQKFVNGLTIELNKVRVGLWHQLAMFAFKPEVQKIFRARAKEWFSKENSDVMNYLGSFTKCHSMNDKAFRENVLKEINEVIE